MSATSGRSLQRWLVRVGGGTGLVTGGWVYYDHQTCHPMRQLHAYQYREGWIRLCNELRPTATFPKLTLDDLAIHDGNGTQPTYFASDGYVWDVSESKLFQDSYALWKGKEASVALAKMSLDPKDVNRTDWESLNKSELDSLHSWTTYFKQKYRIVGRLQGFQTK